MCTLYSVFSSQKLHFQKYIFLISKLYELNIIQIYEQQTKWEIKWCCVNWELSKFSFFFVATTKQKSIQKHVSCKCFLIYYLWYSLYYFCNFLFIFCLSVCLFSLNYYSFQINILLLFWCCCCCCSSPRFLYHVSLFNRTMCIPIKLCRDENLSFNFPL